VAAQIVIGGEGVAQGATLASILAGFAFVGSTSVKDRATVVLYFTAGLLMLISIWAGLMALVAVRGELAPILGTGFFVALGLGSLVFVAATVRHLWLLHGRGIAAWCLVIALVVVIAGTAFVVAVEWR
jgi:hypothetical protein